MQMIHTKKSLLRILCVVLIAAMALVTCGCSNNQSTSSSIPTIVVSDGTTIGQGETQFSLIIADLEGKETKVEVKTDKKTVGEALLELKVIDGDEDKYGLYIKTVNGITADYDVDKTYWAFYIDGEYAMAGVDATDITSGSTYALKVEK